MLNTQEREELEEREAARSSQELEPDQEDPEPELESKLFLVKQQQLKKLKRCWFS